MSVKSHYEPCIWQLIAIPCVDANVWRRDMSAPVFMCVLSCIIIHSSSSAIKL